MAQHFGPDNARLTVRTGRGGAASKAGHDLLIEVGSWEATWDSDAQPALTLNADSRSLRVLEGTGGVKGLDEDDKANIAQTINDEVLKGTSIEFRSTRVDRRDEGSGFSVQGELELNSRRNPVAFELSSGAGQLSGEATLKQTDFGIKPYSALFGALKVADEVRIRVDSAVGQASL
jgi:polyisoprenoid-binding protein YceI